MDTTANSAARTAAETETAMAGEGFAIQVLPSSIRDAFARIDVARAPVILMELTDRTETVKNSVGRDVTFNYVRLTAGSREGVAKTLLRCRFTPLLFDGNGNPGITGKAGTTSAVLSSAELAGIVREIPDSIQIIVNATAGTCTVRTGKDAALKLNYAVPVRSPETVAFLRNMKQEGKLFASVRMPREAVARMAGFAQSVVVPQKSADRDQAQFRGIAVSITDGVRAMVTNRSSMAGGTLGGCEVALPYGEGDDAPFLLLNADAVQGIAGTLQPGACMRLDVRGTEDGPTYTVMSVPATGSEYQFPLTRAFVTGKHFRRAATAHEAKGLTIEFDRKEFLTAAGLLTIGKESSRVRFNLQKGSNDIGIGDYINVSANENGEIVDVLPKNYNQIVIKGRVGGFENLGEADNATIAVSMTTLPRILGSLPLAELENGEGRKTGEYEKVKVVYALNSIICGNVPEGEFLIDGTTKAGLEKTELRNRLTKAR